MLFMKTPEQGCYAQVRCATAPELANETGLYYHEDGNPKTMSRLAQDTELAAKLWKWSEQAIREEG